MIGVLASNRSYLTLLFFVLLILQIEYIKHNESKDKMFQMGRITLWLWIIILCRAVTGKDIELSPLSSVVQAGEELELTCVANYCRNNATFLWKTPMDQNHGGEFRNEQTISHLRIRNISVKQATSVVCKVTCDKETNEKTSKITVYSFPQDPVLDKIKNLTANREQKLNCTVHNIYPLERMEIEWFLGDKKLHTVNNLPSSDHMQNYSSVITYTPTVNNLGKNISCKATLTLDGDWGKNRSSTLEYGPGNMIISNNTSVKLGHHLEITCHADGNPKPRIEWWKLEETGATKQSQNHKLILNNASLSQASLYSCNASNEMGSMQTSVNVTVLDGPGNMIISNNTSVKLGHHLEITCHADGNPKPRIEWWKLEETGATKQSQNHKLILNNASLSQAGLYSCNASNEMGSMQTSVNVIVLDGPGNMIISNNTSVKLGHHLEITCHADGNPKPRIEWWKLEETGATKQSQNHKLILNNASLSQAGLYSCNASNEMGSMQTSVNVTVLGPPGTPKIQLSHSRDPEEGENVTISCSLDGVPAELTLYRQSQRPEKDSGLHESSVLLHISSIQTADADVYVCEAKNEFGLKNNTITINVKAQQITNKMPDLPLAILPAVGSLSLLTIAGLLIRFLRKKASGDPSA